MNKYFGTDGIRGIVNKELTIDLLSNLGKTLSLFNKNKIIIGQDTRISSPMLAFSIIGSLLSMGINVYDEGVTSTPCIAYLSKKFNTIGIMITASHNPFYYNGIKIFINGNKLSQKQEKFIEENIFNDKLSYSNNIGLYHASNLKYKYLNYINKHNSKLNLKIGLDCANGAISFLARDVYKNTSNYLYIFNNISNGYNINDKVGSTYIEAMIDNVKKHQLDIGFSFDGDGDRVITTTKSGHIISGNIIIYLLAIYFFDILGYPNRTVVLTKDSNLGIIRAFNKINIKVILSDIGDNNVRNKMDTEKIILGGEDSGHIITPYSRYGDGLLTSILLLNALSMINIPLEELLVNIELYPFIKQNISKYRKTILNDKLINEAIKSINQKLGNDGFLLLRASGTEDLIRIYLCHKEQNILNECNNNLLNVIDKVGKYYER